MVNIVIGMIIGCLIWYIAFQFGYEKGRDTAVDKADTNDIYKNFPAVNGMFSTDKVMANMYLKNRNSNKYE